MSGLDKLNKVIGVLKGDGGNGGVLTTAAVSQIAGMFSDTPFVGVFAKGAAAAAAADLALRAATGGKHTVMGVAAKALEKAGPKFTQVIETCMGKAGSVNEKSQGTSPMDRIKTALSGLVSGGGAVTEPMAQSAGAAAAEAAKGASVRNV